MANLTAKTTVYLNPTVKKFVQHKAVAEGRSVSEIINDHFEDMLEDLYDIPVIKKRLKEIEKEGTLSFEEVLKSAGISYDDLHCSVR